MLCATFTACSLSIILYIVVVLFGTHRPLFGSCTLTAHNLLLEPLLLLIELPHHVDLGLQIFVQILSLTHVKSVDVVDRADQRVEVALEIRVLLSWRLQRLQEGIHVSLGRYLKHFEFI